LPRSRASVAAWAAIAAAAGFLLARIVPDVDGKPLFEDEAVSGLISPRPVGEVIVTTMWDRGGAPLHFLLTHLAFQFDASAAALRWLSVVFAVATVLVCYDLGRRLAGRIAGVGAAVVAATSGMLAVYGSFGRMYALLAFVSALAATLFVRALDERTAGAALAAAAAAWLLPAVHPYGGIVVAVEALIALVVWRGRPLRPALPVFAVALAMVPFAVADLRLADRFEVSGEAEGRLATWDEAWDQIGSAIGGFAGGEGLTLALFVGLGLGGAIILLRRRPELVIWGLLALAAPPLLATLVRTGRAPDLSPRHLIFALPFFAACVGTAIARLPASPLALAAVSAVAVFSAHGIVDPRSVTYTAALGSEEALAEPAAWLKERVGKDDVLYPYSSVFLAALPETGEAVSLPRGQSQSLLAAVERLDYPVRDLFVAIPVDGPLGAWTIVRASGPFTDDTGLLQRALGTLQAVRVTLPANAPEPVEGWFDLNTEVLCETLSTLGSECVSE
jgi:Dolichyl-phosphate-mannose-protein mannosyltransferase